jgi:sterol desaturase/sphingolipid hydroxylase (fatty acid hydroxylase superfamily)
MKRLTPLIVVGSAVALAVAERRHPLRRRVEPQARRTLQNLGTAAVSAAATAALQRLLLGGIEKRARRLRLGIVNQLPLSPLAKRIAAVLLLDYTLWWWHRANHQVPLLWRFHAIHHADRDLDVSTAVRFHIGEMSFAALFRAAQIVAIGASEEDVAAWQRLLLPAIFFQHSNLRLPEELDAILARLFIVTPRMHGIHHSDVQNETDSNWSSLFPWWDRLHGTLRLDIPQDEITIGLPAATGE